jgi:hypothetical protein
MAKEKGPGLADLVERLNQAEASLTDEPEATVTFEVDAADPVVPRPNLTSLSVRMQSPNVLRQIPSSFNGSQRSLRWS